MDIAQTAWRLADSYTHPGLDGEPVTSLRAAALEIWRLREKCSHQKREIRRLNNALAQRLGRHHAAERLAALEAHVARLAQFVGAVKKEEQ